MSDTVSRLRSCLVLASRATFRGEAEAALAAAGRLIAAHRSFPSIENAAAYFGINLDMGRFDRAPGASEPGDNARGDDIDLNAKQRRILRTKFNGSAYVNAHRPGTRWSFNDMPENIRRALGL